MTVRPEFDFLPTAPQPKSRNTLAFVIIGILMLFILSVGAWIVYQKWFAAPGSARGNQERKEAGALKLLSIAEGKFKGGELDAAENALNTLTESFSGTKPAARGAVLMKKIRQLRKLQETAAGKYEEIMELLQVADFGGAEKKIAEYETVFGKKPPDSRIEELKKRLQDEKKAREMLEKAFVAIEAERFSEATESLNAVALGFSGTFAARKRLEEYRAKLAQKRESYEAAARKALADCAAMKEAGDFSGALTAIQAIKKLYPESKIRDEILKLNSEIQVTLKERSIFENLVKEAVHKMRTGKIDTASVILNGLPVDHDSQTMRRARLEIAAREALRKATESPAPADEKSAKKLWAPVRKAAENLKSGAGDDPIAGKLCSEITSAAESAVREARSHELESAKNKILAEFLKASENDDFNAALKVFEKSREQQEEIRKELKAVWSDYRRKIDRAGINAENALGWKVSGKPPDGLKIVSWEGTIFKKPIKGRDIPPGLYAEIAGYLLGFKNDTPHVIVDIEAMVKFELHHKTYGRKPGVRIPTVVRVDKKEVTTSRSVVVAAFNNGRTNRILLPGETLMLLMESNEVCHGHFQAQPREYFVAKPPLQAKATRTAWLKPGPEDAPRLLLNALRARSHRTDSERSTVTGTAPAAELWKILVELWRRGKGQAELERAVHFIETDSPFAEIIPDYAREFILKSKK